MSLISRAADLTTRFLIWTASINAVRSAARAVSGLLTPGHDIRISFPGYFLYVRTPDRLVAALLWKYSLPSSFEAEIYRSRIKPGMTVMEIGANVGFYTLLFSGLTGEKGRVMAFEPEPLNFRLLARSAAENGRANITCRQAAVSDKSGKVNLYIYEESRGDNCIYDCGDGRPSVETDAVSIDETLGPDGKVDFIKMDIQGAEYKAVLGMERTIRNSPGLTILCEFAPGLIRKAGDSPERLLNKFMEYGFTLNYLDDDSHSVKTASPGELLALCPGAQYLNLLLEKLPA